MLVPLLAGARSAAAACPTGNDLLDLARKAFPDDRRVIVDTPVPLDVKRLHCADVRAAVPLALLTYDIGDDVVLGALASGTDIRWTHGNPLDCTPCVTDREFAALDLDDDGKDELLVYSHKSGHMASSSEWLEVYTIGNDGVPVETPQIIQLGRASYKEYRCTSTVKVVAGPKHTNRLEVIGKCTVGDETPNGFAVGRHVYALHGGKLEEV